MLTFVLIFLSNLDGSSFFFEVVLPKPDMPMAANTSMSAILTEVEAMKALTPASRDLDTAHKSLIYSLTPFFHDAI